jgi:ketosteroid isomerase-like protein
MATPEVAIVLAWHAAVNAGDIGRLVNLSTEDVEVGGPRGSGRGVQLLREWFARAGIQLTPRRIYARGRTVVAEQDAAWSASDDQRVASLFEVRNGKVQRVARYADLATALQAAGLDSMEVCEQA